MEIRICTKCLKEKPLTEFYKHKRDGYQYWCKSCKRKYKREYIKRPEAMEAQKKIYNRLVNEGYFNDYYKKQKENLAFQVKGFARRFANRMKMRGAIEQQPCALCGERNSQIHHPDYAQPLLIVWLCADCHRELHQQLRDEKRIKEKGE